MAQRVLLQTEHFIVFRDDESEEGELNISDYSDRLFFYGKDIPRLIGALKAGWEEIKEEKDSK